jgi:O-antigen ligase
LVFNTIVLCRTRSAFVGLIAGTVVAMFMAPRRRRALIYGALLVGSFSAYSLTDNFYWERVNSTFEVENHKRDPTIQSRIELWGISLQMFTEHPFGVGVGQFRHRLADYNTGEQKYAFNLPRRVTHNSYLLCATELGLHGTLVLAMLVGISLYKIRRAMHLSRALPFTDEAHVLAYCCMIALVTYLGASAFTDRLYTESFWCIMALPACLERSLRFEFERARSPGASTEEDPVPDLRDEWNTTTTYPASGACT